jgi:hypothetical protein
LKRRPDSKDRNIDLIRYLAFEFMVFLAWMSTTKNEGTFALIPFRSHGSSAIVSHALVAGCRGMIPLPGSLRSSAPQGFGLSNAPARIGEVMKAREFGLDGLKQHH